MNVIAEMARVAIAEVVEVAVRGVEEEAVEALQDKGQLVDQEALAAQQHPNVHQWLAEDEVGKRRHAYFSLVAIF